VDLSVPKTIKGIFKDPSPQGGASRPRDSGTGVSFEGMLDTADDAKLSPTTSDSLNKRGREYAQTEQKFVTAPSSPVREGSRKPGFFSLRK
jgi:hypothetical protein